jgi:hypothetical protein
MKGDEEEVLQQCGASADDADGRNEKKKVKKDDEDEEEDEGKYDKGVMELEFKKYTGKSQGQGKGKKNKAESAKDKASAAMGMGGGARPVAGKGKVTKEQMLTAPHSPYKQCFYVKQPMMNMLLIRLKKLLNYTNVHFIIVILVIQRLDLNKQKNKKIV